MIPREGKNLLGSNGGGRGWFGFDKILQEFRPSIGDGLSEGQLFIVHVKDNLSDKELTKG